jgi:hypothetical protein
MKQTTMKPQVSSMNPTLTPADSRHHASRKTSGLFAKPVLTAARHMACAILIAAAPCAVAADANLLENGNAADGLAGWQGFREVAPDPDGGESNCFVLKAGKSAVSEEFIPVNPAKAYTLSGKFRTQDDGEARLYFGVDCYDADKVQITGGEVNVIPGTETTLAADAAVGDTVLKVTDASQWKADGEGALLGRVAFNVDGSGALKDLPNRNLSKTGIPVVHQAANGWNVELTEPLEKAYPKGTKIRQHRNLMAFCYIKGAMNLKLTPVWVEKTMVLTGDSATGMSAAGDQFWPGTRFIRVAVVSAFPKAAREQGDERGPTLVRDLSFSRQ